MTRNEKKESAIAPIEPAARNTSRPSARLPINQLEDDELIDRYEGTLRACYLQGKRILIPSDIRNIFDECRVEVDRRTLTARVTLPEMLCPDDEMPILHQTAIVRYLREPHLSSFMGGLISFAPAVDYRTQTDVARRDDEHVRPYAIFPDQNTVIGGFEYIATKIRMRRNISWKGDSLYPYHFVSFSAEQSRKLAREFHADAAVRIADYQRFFDLLQKQLSVEQPNATLHFKNVEYYDPFASDPSTEGSIDILWRKPIQFIYHREVRMVILSGLPENARINVNIGPSEGLFELVKFSQG
jgi:hypothetical protein